MLPLDRLADALASIRPVRIDPKRCLPLLSPRSHCDACAAVCPEGAIDLRRLPAVQECSGCGLCAAACRADAIALDDPSDHQLLRHFAAAAQRTTRLQLTCRQGPTGPIRVGCLGRLTPELLLAAAAFGFERIDLTPAPGGCGSCRYAAGWPALERAATTAAQVLAAMGAPCRIATGHGPGPAAPAEGRPESTTGERPGARSERGAGREVALPLHEDRRAFLRSAFGLLRELVPEPLRADTGGPREPPRSSRRRELLRWALAHLPTAPLERIPWGEAGVTLAGLCHGCAVCQRLCPNGAIAVEDGHLRLAAHRCHACGLCAQVCPTGALGMGPPRPLSAIAEEAQEDLGRPLTFRCAQCGQEAVAAAPPDQEPDTPRCLACTLRPRPHREAVAT